MSDLVEMSRQEAVFVVALLGHQNNFSGKYNSSPLSKRLIDKFDINEVELCEDYYPNFSFIIRNLNMSAECGTTYDAIEFVYNGEVDGPAG